MSRPKSPTDLERQHNIPQIQTPSHGAPHGVTHHERPRLGSDSSISPVLRFVAALSNYFIIIVSTNSRGANAKARYRLLEFCSDCYRSMFAG